MNKVKVSLREIMEDDNHPLMQRWVSELLPLLKPLLEEQGIKFEEDDKKDKS